MLVCDISRIVGYDRAEKKIDPNPRFPFTYWASSSGPITLSRGLHRNNIILQIILNRVGLEEPSA
jgi:hypothetical protein